MRGHAGQLAIPKSKTHAPAADTPAVATIPADAEERWAIDWIHASFDVATDAAKLLNVVSPAGTTLWSVQLGIQTDAAEGAHPFYFPGGLWAAKGDAVVVTLAADGGGAVGKVNVGYR